MNIIFGDVSNIDELKQKYIVLELDSIRYSVNDPPRQAYCLIEPSINDLVGCDQYIDLHTNLIHYFKKRQWEYCQKALEHLQGKWQGQLDSFYQDLQKRVEQFRQQDPGPDWDGSLDRTTN